MAKLERNDIKRHRKWLSNYQTPLEMAAYVEDIMKSMGSADFFSQGGLAFLRDAWLAAEFGKIRNIPQVRLVDEYQEWPDFEAINNGIVESFECVEADIPNRRRGDEYREKGLDNNIDEDPIENWIARANEVPSALDKAIITKISKKYSGSVSLLVYLNIQEYGIMKGDIERSIYLSMNDCGSLFQRIYILWKNKIYTSDEPHEISAPN